MERALSLKSKVTYGRYKDKSVEEIATKNKAVIVKMIKEGYIFSDQVLSKIGMKKKVHNMKVESQVVEHEKDTKVYEKETMRISDIINSLNTLSNVPTDYKQDNQSGNEDSSLMFN